MIREISSSSNRLIKEIKQLKNKNKRIENRKYIAEGENVVAEAIMYKKDDIDCIIVTEKFIHKIDSEKFDVYVIPDYIMEGISDTKSPQGILAVMKISDTVISCADNSLIVYLDNVADPGNVGTIIRTADAAGVDSVVLSPECADVYSSKVIRATMGSCFHINIVKETEYLDTLKELLNNQYTAVAGSLQAKDFHYKYNMKSKTVICLGNEAHGLSDELMALPGVYPVKIPIVGKAESLNVAIAGAVLMYEALRQRGDSIE